MAASAYHAPRHQGAWTVSRASWAAGNRAPPVASSPLINSQNSCGAVTVKHEEAEEGTDKAETPMICEKLLMAVNAACPPSSCGIKHSPSTAATSPAANEGVTPATSAIRKSQTYHLRSRTASHGMGLVSSGIQNVRISYIFTEKDSVYREEFLACLSLPSGMQFLCGASDRSYSDFINQSKLCL